jgi:hypothetical protein
VNAVVDSPLYDRVLLRSLRRWTGLEGLEDMNKDFDDGNGMYYRFGVSH